LVTLFSELRACNFGVIETTWLYKEFPEELAEIKTRFVTKLKWNTLLAVVVKDTLCLAWQDNNIVLALSNIYIVDKVEDFRVKVKRRLAAMSTNRHIVQRVFENENLKELMIPCFINDYNHYIGGVDFANQFREAYETYKPTFRN
jgi:hypothetical protein